MSKFKKTRRKAIIIWVIDAAFRNLFKKCFLSKILACFEKCGLKFDQDPRGLCSVCISNKFRNAA